MINVPEGAPVLPELVFLKGRGGGEVFGGEKRRERAVRALSAEIAELSALVVLVKLFLRRFSQAATNLFILLSPPSSSAPFRSFPDGSPLIGLCIQWMKGG